MPASRSLVGTTFNSWTIPQEVDRDAHGNRRVLVACECGDEYVRVLNTVRYGTSRCCRRCRFAKRGGVNPGTHNQSNTPEYKIWCAMRERCYDRSNKRYPRYGGRGITVCGQWLGSNGFVNFLENMGRRPSSSLQLDRIDNDGDYSPDNCRWSTRKEQARNRSNNRLITIGSETKTLIEWSEVTSVKYHTIKARIYRGWTPETAVFGKK